MTTLDYMAGRSSLLIFAGIALLAGCFMPPAALAQSRNLSAFKALPLPERSSFALVEFSWMQRIALSLKLPDTYYDESYLLAWEFGYMKNINPKYSLGATVYIAADDEGSRIGFKPRIRRWLTRRISLDFAPGILITKINSQHESFPGFVAHLGVNLNSISVTTQLEVIPIRTYICQGIICSPVVDPPDNFEGTEVSWHAGLRLTSEPGLLGAVASVFIVPWVISAFDEIDISF